MNATACRRARALAPSARRFAVEDLAGEAIRHPGRLHQREDLARRRRRRAEFLDDGAGREVRQLQRRLDRRVGGERQRQHRDDRVARAADVEDGARDRRDAQTLAAGAEQRHAALAARDHDVAAAEQFQQRARPRVRATRRPSTAMPVASFGLAHVGRDAGDAGEQPHVLGLGVGGDHARSLRRLDDLAAEQALRVIAEDHGVIVARAARDRLGHARRGRAWSSGARDSQSARTTCWLCATMRVLRVVGRPATRHDGGAVDRDAVEQRAHAFALGIVADGAGDTDRRADRPQVVGDVARAAERERVVRHGDDRHGGLGRDARDAAPDPLVEHHVADDEHAPPAHPLEQVARVRGREPLRHARARGRSARPRGASARGRAAPGPRTRRSRRRGCRGCPR